jgi:hypothetical protein
MFHANGNFAPSRAAFGMTECGCAWDEYSGEFDAAGGYAGFFDIFRRKKVNLATPKFKKPPSGKRVSTILARHRFLRDEHEKLDKAFVKNDLGKAKKMMLRLARLRDKFRIKAHRVLTNKTIGPIDFLPAAAIGKKLLDRKYPQIRRRKAARLNAKADAAAQLLSFWKAKFARRAKELAKKKKSKGLTASERVLLKEAVANASKLDALTMDGAVAANAEKDADPEEASASESAEAEADSEKDLPEDTKDVASSDNSDDDGSDDDASSSSEEGLSGAQIFGYAALGFGAAFLPTVLRR